MVYLKKFAGYKYGIQFTSFYMPGNFMPHVRMMDEGFSKAEIAKKFGLPYVVVRKVRPYDTATLNYNWQVWDTQAFSLYTSTTSRIDQNGAGKAVLSVMNFLSVQGILKYNVPQLIEPEVIEDIDMISVRTAESGIYEPLVNAGQAVTTGQPLANILNPYEGENNGNIICTCCFKSIFIHNEPLTYANTAVIKLVKNHK